MKAKSEVSHRYAAIRAHEDVARLNIAMNNLGRMGSSYCGANLPEEQEFVERCYAVEVTLGKIAIPAILSDVVRLAIASTILSYLQDAGMAESPKRLDF
jgi:hypothetical protein